MASLDDVLAAENGDAAGLQKLINSGMWSLQGSMGRAMMAAIDRGECLLGRTGARDYWGNYIPGRDEVQAGTKGSFDYVAENSGIEHAEEMNAL